MSTTCVWEQEICMYLLQPLAGPAKLPLQSPLMVLQCPGRMACAEQPGESGSAQSALWMNLCCSKERDITCRSALPALRQVVIFFPSSPLALTLFDQVSAAEHLFSCLYVVDISWIRVPDLLQWAVLAPSGICFINPDSSECPVPFRTALSMYKLDDRCSQRQVLPESEYALLWNNSLTYKSYLKWQFWRRVTDGH